MKRKGLAIGLILCLLLGFLPTNAWADGDGTSEKTLSLNDGSITITGTGYTQEGTSGTECPDSYTITQGEGESSTQNTITIESGTIDMTISGVDIEAANAPAIYVKAGATLNLTVEGENTLTGGPGFAGICVEPAYGEAPDYEYDAGASAKLTISGDGILNANGGGGDGTSGTYGGGAGIGGNGEDQIGGDAVDFGTIVISEAFTGILNATGGASSTYIDGENAFGGGAGIGGGGFNMGYINNYEDISRYYWGEVFGQIEIHNGTIDASSNGNGSGIGGGGGQGEDTAASQISVQIFGGNIEANGGALGAGIGGGAICDGGVISITGGTVTATAGGNDGSMGAAGIGGGNDASVSSVDISGGARVTATASGGAAGIGGGTNTSYSNVHYGDEEGVVSTEKQAIIKISGEGTSVLAYGGTVEGYSGSYGGAGIGSGYPTGNNARSVAFDISITDGASVRTYGGYHAQAIGYGYRPTDFTGYGITLTLDDTIFLWAQNADYYQPALVAATKYDNDRTPVSYSSADVYLIHYVDTNKNATSASVNTAPGYLNQPATDADATLKWSCNEESECVTITEQDGEDPIATVNDVTGLNGNWATLCTSAQKSTTISPAPVTIYMGGEGYDGAIDEEGQGLQSTNGFPEPGFRISAPEGVTNFDPTQATLKYDNGTGDRREWEIVPYDNDVNATHGIYRFKPVGASSATAVRMQFVKKDGTVVTEDDFTITDHLDQDLTMEVYGESIDAGYVTLEYDNQSYTVDAESARLTIRSTTSNVQYGDVETAESDITQGMPGVVATGGTTYYINNDPVKVVNTSEVKLLFDDIIETNGNSNVTLLQDKTAEVLETLEDSALSGSGTRHCQCKYLDLVDTSNGNVWVAASNTITVYWPLPEGTDGDTKFELLHYTDPQLHREEAVEDIAGIINESSIATGTIKCESITNTGTHIKFDVDRAGFSPFVLIWEEDDRNEPDTPVTPNVPDGEDTPDLNTTDHYSYIVGYPEDYRTGAPTEDKDLWPVKPQGNITRAEVATIFYRLLTDEARAENWTQDNSFTDVDKDDWFNTPVSTLSAMGIIGGYEDGSFQPNAPITRAEFAAIAVRFFEEKSVDYEMGSFIDIQGDEWYADAIQAAKEHGIIGGYEDGSFQPNEVITRAEACSIVNRTLKRIPEKEHLLPESLMRVWPDNADVDAWFYEDMQEATSSHEYEWIVYQDETVENWTGDREEIDWDEVERELCALHGVPYEE